MTFGVALSVALSVALGIVVLTPGLMMSQKGPPAAVFRGAEHMVVSRQGKAVTLVLENVTVREALDAIARDCVLAISYAGRDSVLKVKLAEHVSAHFRGTPLEDALATVLKQTGYQALLSDDGRAIMVVPVNGTHGQRRGQSTGTVNGRVTDSASGDGIKGATVSVRETKLTALTNEDGMFTLSAVPAGKQMLTIKAFGYRPATRNVTVADDKPVTVNVVMTRIPTMLSGVVTTATGKQQRLEVGNSVTTIDVDEVMKTAPITSLTDLLEGRVPGLTVQRTSGVPGDPRRLRLRGPSSINRNNDPIIIVDGVRIYSAASDDRNRNRAVPMNLSFPQQSAVSNGVAYAAPSPIDQIDPNTIDHIDVYNGPSAAALYGSDAANGVIVITTKRGQVGPTRWRVTMDKGLSYIPGDYADNVFRWAHHYNGSSLNIGYPYSAGTVLDSIVRFQALNDSRYTVLTRGSTGGASATVSGGSPTLTYSFTGSGNTSTGLLKLPEIEVARFEKFHGAAPPHWMRRPLAYKTWGESGMLTVQPSTTASIAYHGRLFHSNQQRSSLESSVGAMMGTYIDTTQLEPGSIVPNFFERATVQQLTFDNAATVQWLPFSWLPLNGTAGISVQTSHDETLLPRSYVVAYPDSLGHFSTSQGTATTKTLGFNTTIPIPVGGWTHLRTAFGATITQSATTDGLLTTSMLQPGETSPNTLTNPVAGQRTQSATTYGWFVEPQLNFNSRFFIMPGFRLDGGSSYGGRARVNGLSKLSFGALFPKINVSWIASDEPRFPFKGAIDLLRLRAAFGHAGVQPAPADHLRLFSQGSGMLNGQLDPNLAQLSTLGNTQLRPERSTELEGGFDLSVLHDRLQLQVTQYNKQRVDAILSVPVATSVRGGGNIQRNIGTVRNWGTEVQMNARVVESSFLGVDVNLNFSHNANVVKKLVSGETVIPLSNQSRIVPGYPLFGRWARPVVSYKDENQNGIIDPGEVVLGDSLAFLGSQEPKYELNGSTQWTLFNGALSVNAALSYTRGVTQFNGANYSRMRRLVDDPTTPQSVQAAIAGFYGQPSTLYGVIETVHTLRFNTLSVNYVIPSRMSQRIGVPLMTVALQGSNLGLKTNYRGKDPNVNMLSTGNEVADGGQLPQPRSWQLRFTFSR
jgi:TonB-linked SusC/RagA family outer membrane protein